jgi:serine protease Do
LTRGSRLINGPAAGRRSLERSVTQPGYLRRVRIALLIGLVSVSAACASAQDPAALQDFPGTTHQQLIQERTSPAIAYVYTKYQTTVSVPSLDFNSANFDALLNKVITDARTGRIGSDRKSIFDSLATAIAEAPDHYFTPADPVRTAPAKAAGQCSGSIVTPDGYIVTAAHCVQPNDDLRPQFVQDGLKPIIDADVNAFRAGLSDTFDSDQVGKLTSAVTQFLQHHATFSGTTSTVNVVLFTDSSGQRQAAMKQVQVVDKGDPSSKDVAIVKLDGYSQLPTLSVGQDSDISAGQPVFLGGFPSSAAQDNLDSLSTPTVSQGPVTAKKFTEQSIPILQTQAPAAPGNSGGPVLNDAGKLVGVLVSVSTPKVGQGESFAIAVSVVGQFLNEHNIRPRESGTTRLYNRGLNALHRNYYKEALTDFQQAKALYPGMPGAEHSIQQSTEAIQQGKDQTPLLDETALVWVAIGGAAAVLFVASVALLLVIRSRRRRARAAGVQEAGWYETEGGAVSQDGAWRWDGRSWIPNIKVATPAPGETTVRDHVRVPASEERQAAHPERVDEHA